MTLFFISSVHVFPAVFYISSVTTLPAFSPSPGASTPNSPPTRFTRQEFPQDCHLRGTQRPHSSDPCVCYIYSASFFFLICRFPRSRRRFYISSGGPYSQFFLLFYCTDLPRKLLSHHGKHFGLTVGWERKNRMTPNINNKLAGNLLELWSTIKLRNWVGHMILLPWPFHEAYRVAETR